jgi:hypothetical protein
MTTTTRKAALDLVSRVLMFSAMIFIGVIILYWR